MPSRLRAPNAATGLDMTMIRGVLIDLAGVIYDGDRLVPGATAALGRLQEAGLPVRFLTNTTRMPKRGIIARLAAMGVPLPPEELFTPADAARDWLRQNGMSPHLLVHPALREDFAGLEGGKKTAVIVGDAGDAFSYGALNAAFRELLGGAAFLALAKNRKFRDEDGGLSLDAGAFVAALEYASERRAELLGKPSKAFFESALAGIGCTAADTVMIGDDVESDVSGALEAGLGQALLVRTGKYQPGDETRAEPVPTETLADFAAAADWVLARAH